MLVKFEFMCLSFQFEIDPQYEVSIFDSKGNWVKEVHCYTKAGARAKARRLAVYYAKCDLESFDWFVYEKGDKFIDAGTALVATKFQVIESPLRHL